MFPGVSGPSPRLKAHSLGLTNDAAMHVDD